jgi:hypothetical protein
MSRLIGKLPASAEALLKEAANTGLPGSLDRRIAIDRAYETIAKRYPETLKSDPRNQNMKIQVPARAAFLNLFTAASYENGPPKWNGKFIIDPADTATVKKLDEGMMAAARLKWGEKAEKIMAGLVKTGKPKTLEVAFIKQPYLDKEGDAYDGFEGMYYISASADPKRDPRPLVIDRDTSPLVESDGKPYGGCHVIVQVEFWAQDNNFGKAIRATLKAVQFVRDGDAFTGGAPAVPSDFAPIADGSDAGDLA